MNYLRVAATGGGLPRVSVVPPPSPRGAGLWLLTFALLAATILVWSTGVELAFTPGNWFIWPLLTFSFLAAESSQMHIVVRRQTYSVSLSELPLVLALFLMPPLAILGARLAASAALFVLRRVTLPKAAFNLALFAAEVTAAVAVFGAVGSGEPTHPSSWLAAYLAAGAAAMVSGLAVALAIHLMQARISLSRAANLLAPTLATAMFSTTVALVLLAVTLQNPVGWVLVLLLAVLVAAAYRHYASLVQQHKSLGDLYEFTRAVGTALHEGGIDRAVLERVRGLLGAERATLWLRAMDTHGELLLSKQADAELSVEWVRDGDLDPLRHQVLGTGRPLLANQRSGDARSRPGLRARGADEVMIAPLRSGRDVVGCLEVADRLGERSAFGDEDIPMLQTLAAHTAVAVENSRLVERLTREASHDPLTGLPNRRQFLKALSHAMTEMNPPGRIIAALELDLESFKDVNDTLGYIFGDRLIADVGRRLNDWVADPTRVARLSSDEFGMFVVVADAEEAHAAAVALRDILHEPFLIGDVAVNVRGHVGFALSPEHAGDADILLQRADIAMYAAKGVLGGVRGYREAMDVATTRRFELLTQLPRALERGEVVVWYQPQVSLDAAELVGVEALVRWQHPQQGLIQPNDFVPVVEHTELIAPLTSYVLRTSLEQCRRWLDVGREISISVNLSTRSLQDPDFPEEVARHLHSARVPARLLTLEITESSVMTDLDRALPNMRTLRELGVGISVDDFGTGYSSLAYLRRLPINEVKVDKSFVFTMVSDPEDLAIVRTIVELARNLRLKVVAEGVESDLARALLQQIGCDVAQGYFFSRPVPVDGLERWIEARTVMEPLPRDSGTVRRLRVVGS